MMPLGTGLRPHTGARGPAPAARGRRPRGGGSGSSALGIFCAGWCMIILLITLGASLAASRCMALDAWMMVILVGRLAWMMGILLISLDEWPLFVAMLVHFSHLCRIGPKP